VTDAVEGVHMFRDPSALVERLHGAESPLGLGWPVGGIVCSV
jgi:hypothetical protein